jgi:hypothetical protein
MHLMAASRSLIGKEKEKAELCRLGWAFAGWVKKLGIKKAVSGLSYQILMMDEENRPRLSDQMK